MRGCQVPGSGAKLTRDQEETMAEEEVGIVKLEPMRVAATLGFGSQPEIEAWDKLTSWARAVNLLDGTQRFFGFNNPNPMPGSPNYGYEQWVTVGPDVEPLGDVEMKDFEGGLFGVLHSSGLATIEEDWGRLAAWLEASPYRADHRQCLEELLTSPVLPQAEWVFDLYVAIAE
jgi:DNA gyrase inhibitor GyrI